MRSLQIDPEWVEGAALRLSYLMEDADGTRSMFGNSPTTQHLLFAERAEGRVEGAKRILVALHGPAFWKTLETRAFEIVANRSVKRESEEWAKSRGVQKAAVMSDKWDGVF